MTFEPTKPVQTRDGRKARIICTDLQGSQPITAAIMERGTEIIATFHATGIWAPDSRESCHDLINTTEKRCIVGWMNIYDNSDDSFIGGGIFKTREDADNGAGISRIGCIKIDQEYEVIQP